MDPYDLVKLRPLMDRSEGNENISICMIDGPVQFQHPSLSELKVLENNQPDLQKCRNSNSNACKHGTFIASILFGRRDSKAVSIAPKCTLALYPIFDENSVGIPITTLDILAEKIRNAIDDGVRIINLSLSLTTSCIIKQSELFNVYDLATRKGVILIMAAGNQGEINSSPLITHNWIIPVAASNVNGMVSSISNIGPSIGKKGLMAPGTNIVGASSQTGDFVVSSGTSYAAPFVTGTIALLWSLFPQANTYEIISAIRSKRRRSIIPPFLNAEEAFLLLNKIMKK
jgi:subtilisin family serine protease